VPVEFEDCEALEDLLSEKRNHRVEIRTPQRGQKKALLDLVRNNAKHSFDTRFHVLKPSSRAIQKALEDALNLPAAPARIECFDVSHIQGTDKVASMVVWEDGRMKKSDYRKFIVKTVIGNDDYASMREVVARRYARVQKEKRPMPGLVLIDGGMGQLHAAAEALEAVGITTSRWPPSPNARRSYTSTGRRTSRWCWTLLAHPAPDSIDPRRGAPLRRHVPSQPAERAAAHERTGRHPGRGKKDGAEAPEGVGQLGAGARGLGRPVGRGGGPCRRATRESALRGRQDSSVTRSPAVRHEKIRKDMRYRLLAGVFAFCLVAAAQTLSLRELVSFVQSSEKLIKEGKQTDGELAKYLAKVRLTERLDDCVIEDLQSQGIGRDLAGPSGVRDRTKDLMAAKPIAPKPAHAIPPPTSEEQAAILSDVREYALNYSKNCQTSFARR